MPGSISALHAVSHLILTTIFFTNVPIFPDENNESKNLCKLSKVTHYPNLLLEII